MLARYTNARKSVVRSTCVLALLLIMPVLASAYTIVMRGGKRIEIPSHFTLTSSTLTYEVSSGVQVTLETAAIDIAATEKVNNEPPGSFLRRVRSASDESTAITEAGVSHSANPPVRTITNRDLESTAQRRRASELAYENRRKQLGLPAAEESRRQAAAESEAIANQLAKSRSADKQSENYWRGRASALRTETSAIDAELTYFRRQLDETATANFNGSFISVTTGLPLGLLGSIGSQGQFRRGGFGRPVTHRPMVFGPPRNSSQVRGQIGLDRDSTRGRVFINPLGFPRSHSGCFPYFAPNITMFGSTPTYDSYDRNWLITRFNELAASRAGVNARWRELEDEARRAGAPPGWLRP